MDELERVMRKQLEELRQQQAKIAESIAQLMHAANVLGYAIGNGSGDPRSGGGGKNPRVVLYRGMRKRVLTALREKDQTLKELSRTLATPIRPVSNAVSGLKQQGIIVQHNQVLSLCEPKEGNETP